MIIKIDILIYKKIDILIYYIYYIYNKQMKYIIYFLISFVSSFRHNPLRLSHLIPIQIDNTNTNTNTTLMDIWNDGEVSWLDIVK